MNRIRALVVSVLLTAPIGCFHEQTTTRSQAADDAADKDAVTTVGLNTTVGNVEPITVYGVGLVHNLDGTGSSPPADGYRASVEKMIRKEKGNPKEILDDPSKSTSIVLVSATIPPGAKQGDKIDVAIALPPGSKTTSLKNGILWPCDLQNMEFAAAAREALAGTGAVSKPTSGIPDNAVLAGNRLAIAQGPIIAGRDSSRSEDGDENTGPRSGRIWGGAKNLLPRPYYFILNESTPQARMAMVMAERLNDVFHTEGDVSGKIAEAKVQGKLPVVFVYTSPAYRLNHVRFLVVARHVPLSPVAPDSPYRKQLENDLLRPETALVAAVKLEALGSESRRALRVGLQSESPWVRFASAESLVYLGYADGARDLAELAEKHPALRAHCLTALASLDDALCLDQLVELMKKKDPNLRYGAFSALRAADENHEAIRGRKAGDSYRLHHVASDSDPLIHVATVGRAEIVLFGSRFPLAGPFSFPLGKEFTVHAKEGEPTVSVSRVYMKNGEPTTTKIVCLADVGEVLNTLREMGGTYSESLEFIHRVRKTEVGSSPIAFDALPPILSTQQLALISRSDPNLERANKETEQVGRHAEDVSLASAELPNDSDGVKAAAKQEPNSRTLNREPGRLFGSKHKDAEEPTKDAKDAEAKPSAKTILPTSLFDK